MEIRLVGTELFHENGRTGDEACRFLQFCERA